MEVPLVLNSKMLPWLCFWLLAQTPVTEAAPPVRQAEQHAMMAALLFNFGKFVSWPDSSFESAQSPFCIGLVRGGPELDRLAKSLRTIARKKEIGGRRVEIRRLDLGPEQNRSRQDRCQILFYTDRSAPADETAGLPALSVGTDQGFLQNGGMILLSVVDGKVKIHIHEGRARQAGLAINAGLLDIAESVITDRPKGHP